MSKLEERESRRRSSVVGSMVDSVPAVASGKKGRPKEDRETKKRVSLSVLPSPVSYTHLTLPTIGG